MSPNINVNRLIVICNDNIFYVCNHWLVHAKNDPNKYRLEIIKEGSKHIQITLNGFNKIPHKSLSAQLQCAGNGYSSMSAAKQVCFFKNGVDDISILLGLMFY